MKKTLLYSLVGLSLSSTSFIAQAYGACSYTAKGADIITKGTSACIDAGTLGQDITIDTPITTITLNDKNNVLRLHNDFSADIDGKKGSDEIVLQELHSPLPSDPWLGAITTETISGTHKITGAIKGIESIETIDGTWEFTKEVHLGADVPSITELAASNGSQTPNLESVKPATASYFPTLAQLSSATLIFDKKLYLGLTLQSPKPTDATQNQPINAHITAGHVQLKGGFQLEIFQGLQALPKKNYSTTLIDSADITDGNGSKDITDTAGNKLTPGTPNVWDDGNWHIQETLDDKGLHIKVAAGNNPNFSAIPDATSTTTATATGTGTDAGSTTTDGDSSGGGDATLNYNPKELKYNDDITFAISNQASKYRTDTIVAHDSKFIDFSVARDSAGTYQNLSLIEAHLNISSAFTQDAPVLHNTDERNMINLQVGYYHGSGQTGKEGADSQSYMGSDTESDMESDMESDTDSNSTADFKRFVNAYSIGSAVKFYNPFKRKNAGFLRDLWFSTGFDLGFAQQYDISRMNVDWDQTTLEGKENDFFLTNTSLIGIDLYGHFKYKNGVKLVVSPYVGLGLNAYRFGMYTEVARNPLIIDSTYRFNAYGIFGVHAKTIYRFKNNQVVGIGATIETNYRFRNTASTDNTDITEKTVSTDKDGKTSTFTRRFSYKHWKSSDIIDNVYKKYPITFGIDATYQPIPNLALFTKANYSTAELYNYNVEIGAKFNF